MAKFETVEQYLAALPAEVGEPLSVVLGRISAQVPDPALVLSYQIPTLTSAGRRVAHVAGWKSHLAIYPVPDDPDLRPELVPYLSGQSTLRFRLSQPIPYELIDRVVAALFAQQDR